MLTATTLPKIVIHQSEHRRRRRIPGMWGCGDLPIRTLDVIAGLRPESADLADLRVAEFSIEINETDRRFFSGSSGTMPD